MEGLGWSEPLAFRLCFSSVSTRHMMDSLYLRYPSVPLTKEENPWGQEVLLGKAKFHEDCKKSTGTLRNSFVFHSMLPSCEEVWLWRRHTLLGPCESERPSEDTWLACVYCHILRFWNIYISWTTGLETVLEHMFCFSFLRKTRRSVMQEMIERASDKKQVTKVSGKFNGIDKGFHSSLEGKGVLVWKEHLFEF